MASLPRRARIASGLALTLTLLLLATATATRPNPSSPSYFTVPVTKGAVNPVLPPSPRPGNPSANYAASTDASLLAGEGDSDGGDDEGNDDTAGPNEPELSAFTPINRRANGKENKPLPATSRGKFKGTSAAVRNVHTKDAVVTVDGIDVVERAWVNQNFYSEPPDQALCAGNGFVLEAINGALRVYQGNSSVSPLTDFIDLNTFYGYSGENLGGRTVRPTDPTCFYDARSQRWFVNTLLLQTSNGGLTGANFMGIAVSTTANPTGGWTVYTLPAHNNGRDGTPSFGCAGGWCLGDFPHIAVDSSNLYISTNEFAFFARGYYGSNIYIVPKAGLFSGATSFPAAMIYVGNPASDYYSFTVFPARNFSTGETGDVQFFMSTIDARYDDEGTDVVSLFQLDGVKTFAETGDLSALKLTDSAAVLANGVRYKAPDAAPQTKPGSSPALECFNDDNGCCKASGLFSGLCPGTNNKAVPPLDVLGGRMGSVSVGQGWLVAVWSSMVIIGDRELTGVAWTMVNPVSKKVVNSGLFGLPKNHLVHPVVAMLPNGKGVVSFTVSGDDYYPSAGYALITKQGVGEVVVVAEGNSLLESYSYLLYDRARWGDYGASAVAEGGNIWFASAYVPGKDCSLADWKGDRKCGNTRMSLANWGTRISRITIK